MKTSILLPAHNRAEVIGFSIRSILAQTEPDWELLVVGDGCIDHTAAVVTGFADPRIRWFDLPKAPGFGYANRNIALHEATGDFIAYAAHDDLWLPDHLTKLLAIIEETGADLAYSRPLWVEPGGQIYPGDFDLRDPGTLAAFLEQRSNGIPSSCVLHRRSCFAQVGYWDATLEKHADWDMWTRILRASEKPAAYLPTPTCLHFRANWRSVSNVISRVATLPELHARFPVLRLPQPPLEQEIAWREMTSASQNWPEAVREAIEDTDQVIAGREQAVMEAFDRAPIHCLALPAQTIRAEDHDPRMVLPPCDFRNGSHVICLVEITSPHTTMFQIFYRNEGEGQFSEARSIRRDLYPGGNVLYLVLPLAGQRSTVRVDVASHPGEYLLHRLEIRVSLETLVDF